MDWPVVAGDVFVATAAVVLVAAPLAGMHRLGRAALVAAAALLLVSTGFLSWHWRHISGGVSAAIDGHIALLIASIALAQLGRAARALFDDQLTAAMASLTIGILAIAGIFAMAPLTNDVSAPAGAWLLLLNPLVAAASAAGIDLLHLDTFYRTSPLAHRGVTVPAWTTACFVYAVVGLAAYGASRIRPWSRQS